MFKTRKGTKVLNARAARLAICHETYWDDRSAEYRAYRDVIVRGEVFAVSGDPIYVAQNEDRPDRVFATNLTFGNATTMSWDDLANTVKPAEQKFATSSCTVHEPGACYAGCPDSFEEVL